MMSDAGAKTENGRRDTARQYEDLVGDDKSTWRALLACAAALRLDDEVACRVVGVVSPSDSARNLVARVKRLGCIWERWDGSWYLAEDVRVPLAERLDQELPTDQVHEIRTCLATYAADQASSLAPDGQVTDYRARRAWLESAYQNLLTPNRSDAGAQQLTFLWKNAERGSARDAIARSVDHVADEIETRVPKLPPEVCFMRGMAARSRRESKTAERWFRAVWEQGRRGEIYAAAAHFLGNLTRDKKFAERVLNDSIEWNEFSFHKAQVWHSLGNLLSRQSGRWQEAEQAYRTSLKLDPNVQGQGQVWHSLGNLLSRQSGRSEEAEQAYRTSLELRHDPQDRAQVWHSLGNLLSRQSGRWEEAEQAYRTSLELRHDPHHQGQVWHSLGNLLSRQSGRREQAEQAYHRSLELLHSATDQGQVWHSLAQLLSKDPPRWGDAGRAFGTSLRFLSRPEDQAQVFTSWASAMVQSGKAKSLPLAERLAQKALALSHGDLRDHAIISQVLANIYEHMGQTENAIEALQAAISANQRLGDLRRIRTQKEQLRRLHSRLKARDEPASASASPPAEPDAPDEVGGAAAPYDEIDTGGEMTAGAE